MTEQTQLQTEVINDVNPQTVAHMLQTAIDKAGSGVEVVEVVERLAALMERQQDRQAKRDFNTAMARFQAECPQIPKKRTQGGVSNSGASRHVKYAALQDIDEVIRPHLRENQLSYSGSFVNDPEGGKSWMLYRVTVRHANGHEETYDGPKIPYDSKLAANDSQKGGSTASYAIRYAVGPALGLVFQGDDTDGTPPPDNSVKITEDQVRDLSVLIAEVDKDGKTEQRFLNWCAKEFHMAINILEDIPASQYRKVVAKLESKRGAK